jgi:hypothetical protein
MIVKYTQIFEVLDDGTIYAFNLEVCDREAEKVLKNLYKKEGKLFNYDYTATVFALFVFCIHILKQAGWQTDELINEVLDHSQEYDDDEEEDNEE